MKLQILKCHGSGNNFILINEYDEVLFSEEERVALSKFLCDKEEVDGILYFQRSKTADGKMRMFNPDGSEAEMCGNGLRCIGRFACENLGKEWVIIETLKSVSTVVKVANIYKDVKTFQAELNTISLNTKEIPISVNSESLINQPLPTLSTDLTFTAVSMPNPHIVSIVERISDTQLEAIGKKANQLTALFPNGVNVNFCQIIDDGAIFVRTYERGVGLTNSCGSGMSATSLVSCLLRHNPFGKAIDVYNRGGLVKCEPRKSTSDQYSVFLSGNATFMFSSFIEFDLPSVNYIAQTCSKIFVDEIQEYGRFLEYSDFNYKDLV